VVVAVAAGGASGALARAGVDVIAGAHAHAWPVLLINMVGSFGLGALTVLVLARGGPTWVGPALGTGFLGGFTTFSGYVVGAQTLMLSGSPALALAYAVLTPLLCIAAAALGSQTLRLTGTVRGVARRRGSGS